MKPAKLLLAAVCAALAAASGAARADTVELKEGVKLEGQVLSEKCKDCAGSGLAECPACTGTGLDGKDPCPTCAGAKRLKCPACAGLGIAGDKVRIRVRAGVIELSRAQVRSITWKAVDLKDLLPAAEYYKQALAKLDPKDPRGAFDLAVWCAANSMEAEARRHFAAAAALDAKLSAAVEGQLAELARRKEAEAVKALLAALALLERKGPAEGAPALRAFQKSYAETELARRVELQRDLIRAQFPKLAAGGADGVEALARAAEDQLAARCEACGGTGREKCPDCKGSTEGRCPDCSGAGQAPCPVCAGTARLTCPTCFGSGRYRGGPTLGYNFERACPDCNGAKELVCDVCAGKGKRPCKRCAGTGKLPAACPGCAGQGTITCRKCGGSGNRSVDLFTWGPPPVRVAGLINVGGPGGRARAWQGQYAGAVLTAVPAETLYRATLANVVEGASGRKLRVLAVALDNRKGTKLLRLRPADKCLRGVTEDHAQVEIVNLPKLLAPKEENAQVKAISKQAADRDCLPGAYECVLVALPEGTDLEALAALFWLPGGEADPARLAPIWLADDEVNDLRKSLR